MKKSVGLVVLTEIPNENGEKALAVVLQRRGMWNMEKMRSESFPCCCQVTVHGGLENKETFHEALIRESYEELGDKFGSLLQNTAIKLIEVAHKSTTEKEVVTFGTFIDIETIKMIRLLPDSGGLDIIEQSKIEKDDGLIEITEEMRESGCPPKMRAMRDDEILAVRKVFEIIKKQ